MKGFTRIILFSAFIFAIRPSENLLAQNVGIGIASPATKLHIAGTTSTLRLEGISSVLGGTHIVAAAASTDKITFVNANGDFKAMPNGSSGQVLTINGSGVPAWATAISLSDWSLTGNFGTVAGTNFIGTTDAVDFVIKTGGSAATNERLRVLSAGQTVLNKTTVAAGDLFSAYGTGYTGAISSLGAFVINGYTGANGIGVYGESNASAGTNTGVGVLGSLQGVNAGAGFANYGVYGENLTTPNATGYSIGTEGIASSTTGNARGVEGISASVSGIGIAGFNTAASLTTNIGYGMYGQVNGTISTGFAIGIRGNVTTTAGSNAYGVYGSSASDDGVAVVAFGNTNLGAIGTGESAYAMYGQVDGTVTGTGVAIGVLGIPTPTSGDVRGVSGQSPSSTGVGVIGFATGAANTGAGVQGQNAGAGDAIRGISTAAAGTAGSGVYGETPSNGVLAGVEGYGSNASGTGGLFYGDGTATIVTVAAGCGSSSIGSLAGGTGWATSSTAGTLRFGGYFDTNAGTSYAYVGAITAANVNRKIEGNGTVNTTVTDVHGNKVVLSAPEAPENLFMDFGKGELKDGKAQIQLDPNFSKNIVVNEKHPLRVIIQLEGDCSGVYVTDKTKHGFQVIEIAGGQSNIPFTYFVAANRADEVNPDGTIAKYSEERFGPAIGAQAFVSKPILQNSHSVLSEITKLEEQPKSISQSSINTEGAPYSMKQKLFR